MSKCTLASSDQLWQVLPHTHYSSDQFSYYIFTKMASTRNTADQQRSKSCLTRWIESQEQDLSEPLEAQQRRQHSPKHDRVRQLMGKGIKGFQDYLEERNQLACIDVSVFFAPAWCTWWEKSLIWLADPPSSSALCMHSSAWISKHSSSSFFKEATLATSEPSPTSSSTKLIIYRGRL